MEKLRQREKGILSQKERPVTLGSRSAKKNPNYNNERYQITHVDTS